MNISSNKSNRPFIFRSASRCVFIVACILIIVGYVLMAGPGSTDESFNPDSTDESFNPDIFSPRRIVIAPMLCLAGYLLIIIGILKKK